MTDSFLTLVEEAGIEFSAPAGFVPCPVFENQVFRYQHAVRSPCGELELRYSIDFFVLLEVLRNTESAGVEVLSSVKLEQMHSTNFMAILMNLSGGRFSEPTLFSPETTALLYAADWSALSFMRLGNSNFAPEYNSAFLLTIHKNGIADVYVVGLYNDSCDGSENFDKNNLPAVVKKNLAPTLRFT